MVLRSAVRLSDRQLRRLAALDHGRPPIADVHREWARWSAENGLTRPSYECTRVLVHALRELRRNERRTRDVLIDIAFRHRDPLDLERHLAGERIAAR